MKGLRWRLMGIAVLAGIGVAGYQLLLTPEAKRSVSRMAQTIRESYARIMQSYGDANSLTMNEDVLPNREATISQWESIGF